MEGCEVLEIAGKLARRMQEKTGDGGCYPPAATTCKSEGGTNGSGGCFSSSGVGTGGRDKHCGWFGEEWRIAAIGLSVCVQSVS